MRKISPALPLPKAIDSVLLINAKMFLFRNKASLFSLKLMVNIWEQRITKPTCDFKLDRHVSLPLQCVMAATLHPFRI